MSKALDDLVPALRVKAFELIARCAEAGIPVMVIDTRRTEAEHQLNLARGVSWTKRSKHLDGRAIDICPYALFDAKGPDKLAWGNGSIWQQIGEIGKALGLKWGGDWAQRDYSHFELPDEPIGKQA
jgi:peptidoglycan L-alanyl-D-glutamate endopeptidase CwlK